MDINMLREMKINQEVKEEMKEEIDDVLLESPNNSRKNLTGMAEQLNEGLKVEIEQLDDYDDTKEHATVTYNNSSFWNSASSFDEGELEALFKDL